VYTASKYKTLELVTNGRSTGLKPPCIPELDVLRYMVAALN